MKSLHARLDPRKDQVLEYLENFGHFKTMTEFGVLDYACFVTWIEEVTGDKDFGLHPRLSTAGGQTLGDQLIEAMLRKVVDLERSLAERDKRIALLEWQLSHAKEKENLQALAVMSACK